MEHWNREFNWLSVLVKGVICSMLQNSIDYAVLGASSKFAAILLTYPYQAFFLYLSYLMFISFLS